MNMDQQKDRHTDRRTGGHSFLQILSLRMLGLGYGSKNCFLYFWESRRIKTKPLNQIQVSLQEFLVANSKVA